MHTISMHKILWVLTTMAVLVASGHAIAQTAQQPAAPAEVIVLAGSLETCVTCHGENGVSRVPTYPTLAGQKVNYLIRQMDVFRQSKDKISSAPNSDAPAEGYAAKPPASRFDPLMEHVAAGLSDNEISRIAVALAQLPCDGGETKAAPISPPVKPQAAQRCEACHGETGVSVMSHVPNIAGQQRGYLRRQLLIIRENAYGATPRENERWRTHPIMERQAGRLSIEEVDILAQYYAALDCRTPAKP